MLIVISSYIIWVLYAIIEGYREGKYWYLLGKTNILPSTEHKIWTLQRAMVVLLATSVIFIPVVQVINLLFILICALAFPFFHDGTYYYTRNRLSQQDPSEKVIYKKGFFDQSTTSTSWMTFIQGPIMRSIYLVISVFLFILLL